MNRQIISLANGDIQLVENERSELIAAPFTSAQRDAAIAAFFTPDIPAQVPMYKVRKYLIMEGLMAATEAALQALPEPNRALALVDWEFAPNLVVQSSLALGIAAALGLTEAEYEQMVLAADALP